MLKGYHQRCFATEFYKYLKKTSSNPQTVSKGWKWRKPSKVILEAWPFPKVKDAQEFYKRGKLQFYISD